MAKSKKDIIERLIKFFQDAKKIIAKKDRETITKIEQLVSPEYLDRFWHFCETGEASQDFLDFLSKDKKCQEAVEFFFNTTAEGFEELAKILRSVVAN